MSVVLLNLLVFAACFAGFAFLGLLWARRLRQTRPARWAFCPNCGYNLFGNVSGVCSECGFRANAPQSQTSADDHTTEAGSQTLEDRQALSSRKGKDRL
jgi:hypothetical protein